MVVKGMLCDAGSEESADLGLSLLGVPAVEKKTAVTTLAEQGLLLLQVLDALSKNTLESFLHQILTAIAAKFASRQAYLCLHCQKEDVLSLRALCAQDEPWPLKSSSGPSVSLSRTVKPGSLWRKLVRRRGALLIPNAANDSRVPFRDLFSGRTSHHLLLLPLTTGNEVLGFIGTVVLDAKLCTPEKIEFATVLSQPATLAARLIGLIERASQYAVLQERSRMAREGAEEARRAVFALHPKALAKQRLADALQQLADEITRDTRVRTTFSLCGVAPPLAPEVELQLLRITQEALTNILKHAAATTAHIELVSDGRWVELSIQDDGHGSKRWPSRRTQGFGLLGMTKRARQVGGRLVILPKPGHGTQIQVKVPLKMESAAREEYA